MQQYKQARENNPQLKYWDWKKENDLGYQLYKNNLPSNLQVETDDYDLYGAYESNKKKTGKTTEELTHSKNPVTRKRAIFAQNAAKWNKGKKKKK